MKKAKAAFLTVIVSSVLYAAGGVFQKSQASEDVREMLDANIRQSAVKVNEQEQRESRARKEILNEGKQRQLKLLDGEAGKYAREGHYIEAICVYDEMLRMAPESSRQIEKEIRSCLKKLRASVEKRRQREGKENSLQLMRSAEQTLQEREGIFKEEKERKELIESAQVAQHLSLGNFYLTNKQYSLAVNEFEKALRIKPDHGEAMGRLAKATLLLSKQNAEPAEETSPPIVQQDIDYNKLIREDFERSQAYLDSGNYGSARDEFSRILDRIDDINRGNSELETAKQIKQASQRGTTQVISDIRSNKYDAARKRLLELIEKTSLLAGQKEEQEMRDRTRLLVEGYLKHASEFLEKAEYENAKLELEKVFELDPQNKKASALLDRLGDVISIVNESP